MSRRPPALFVGDALGLDFLNSIATPIDTPVDWIDDGEGLLSWLEQARLVPADALKSIGRGLFRANSTRWRIRPAACASGSGALCASTWGALWQRRLCYS